MSFFGFEQNDLEREKQQFISGQVKEDGLAEYTWGEDSYDGLGDALQEGGDDLNDETFGGVGEVGKDFDFTRQVLSDNVPAELRRTTAVQQSNGFPQERSLSPPQKQAPSSYTSSSLQSLWDSKSPFSVLPRGFASTSRVDDHHVRAAASPDLLSHSQSAYPTFSPFADMAAPVTHSPALSQESIFPRASSQMEGRTLQEIEAEMRASAVRSREAPQLRQQQLLQAQARTPPPRLHPHAQSPRFHQLQQHILIQQQQQQKQQQQQLQDLQEQLRAEELERQLRAQQISQLQQQQLLLRRQSPSGPTLAEIQAAQHLAQLQQEQRRRQRSPAADQRYHVPQPLQESAQFLPQNIQMQQRLLAELAQAEFIREYGTPQTQEEQEALRAEAVRKIMEAERMEEKRRRKAAKIAHMSRYNDLMTQSDKDFITRIQVSQLVTQDPYLEDWYCQTWNQIIRAKQGLQPEEQRVLTFDSGVGVGLGIPGQRPSGRKLSAVQRMEAQVERIVNNARQREKEKGLQSLSSLQGALGKTAGRSYKAAPRQLLQVDSPRPAANGDHSEDEYKTDFEVHAAKEAAKLRKGVLGEMHDEHNFVRRDPLTHLEVLAIIEHLYDLVLQLGAIERYDLSEDVEGANERREQRKRLVDSLYEGLRANLPIETSNPHPFISLLGPMKGKVLFPRVAHVLEEDQLLIVLTLLITCLTQLDVVAGAHLLDSMEDTPERRDMERQTNAFQHYVLIVSVLHALQKVTLRELTGILRLLRDQGQIVTIARTKPGLDLLFLLLSRADLLIHTHTYDLGADSTPQLSMEDVEVWQSEFDLMFSALHPHLTELFPSERILRAQSGGSAQIPPEHMDTAAWQFLASVGAMASLPQQQMLVTALREKVLDLVIGVKKGWVADSEERDMKTKNVNTFLHALKLDSSQIAV
ncbi:hypothetical protein OE88DRAFT_1658294 [Heliocybe sulcata]|uniref:mRNA decay factor PAT1 domain-containing protein n=1 Tax=Heliocybe sulcata TaxID=5364 RepID=A0A5C3N6K3_9AGAM|nr:hypothetical protein OE88DRAFT_1658294 [Heliocybe sulcata]